MTKINTFFSEISQQIHKMYEKVAIITQSWAQTQMLFYKHEQRMVLVWTKSPHSSLKYHNTQNLWKNNHNYSNLAQSQILFYMHEQPMLPDHGMQYEESASSHHGGMLKDRLKGWLTDWLTDGLDLSCIPRFHLGGWSGE